jgi:hypothetical protein
MARTRDIVLAFLFLGLLLIGLVLIVVILPNEKNTFSYSVAETDPVETASVITALNQKNTDIVIDEWKKRLKNFKISPAIVVDVASEDTAHTSDTLPKEVKKCTNYSIYTKIIPPLNSYVAEGARVYTSSTEAGGYEEQVFLVIPVRDWFIKGSNCLPSDVVGIATNGLLMRNNQFNIYSIFGSETLIGYALDGYPIYGLTKSDSVDECGGTQVGEGYHYYLTNDRQSILRCFRAQPVLLP